MKRASTPNRAIVILGSLSVGLTASWIAWALHDPAEVHGPNDPAFYWAMANGDRVSAPFGYRVLVPGAVRTLPVNHHVGFVVMTGLAVALLVGALFTWLARYAPLGRAVVGVALVLASAPVWTQVRSPYRNDVAMMALMAVGALYADRDRWACFAVAAALAVLTRDVAVIMALVPLAAYVRGRSRAALAAVATTVAAFVVVRCCVPVIPRELQHPGEILAFRAASDGGLARSVTIALGASFGAAWLFVPLAWKRLSVATKRWALVALVAAPTLLIASDWPRLLAPAFPLVAMAAVRSRTGTSGIAVVAGLLGLGTILGLAPAGLLATTVAGVLVILRWPSRARGVEAEAAPSMVDSGLLLRFGRGPSHGKLE